MKISQYTSIVPYKNKFALYNSFENKVVFIEKELKDLVNENKHNIKNIENIHPTFFQYIKRGKFIVENDLDELKKVKDLSYDIDNNDDSFLLTVNPTMNCNFRCWYCYETRIKDSRINISMLDSIKKFITNTIKESRIKFFSLSFFGGEPLLFFNKNVTPLIDHIQKESKEYNKEFYISFTTNGYLINDKFIEYFLTKNIPVYLQITFDGNREQHDKVRYINNKRGSYDEIVKNIKRILLYDIFTVRARINYTSENVKSCFEIMDDFVDLPEIIKESRLVFDFHRVWQDDREDELGDVINENIQHIKDKGFNVSVKYAPNNVKESCYADKRNSAVINYNGDIYKCTARDFKREHRLGYRTEEGQLIWENNSLENRMNSKFKNKPCLLCSILPICNGGCTQHALEHLQEGEDYCVYFFSKEEINRVILSKIDEIVTLYEKR